MKILVINGSPKAGRSNSLKITLAFLEGLKQKEKESGIETELCQLEVSKLNIHPCRGCFACWKATPGVCCIKDDMAMVIEKELWADLIVWSFPLYYFNVPGALKNLIDRQLPMVLPFMSERTDGVGSGSHESRYDMSRKRHMLISTCGFYSAKGNYDSVCGMFDHIAGKGKYDTIFCGQGELFRVKELSERTNAYLEIVKAAGQEYAEGGISPATLQKLQELLFPKAAFEAMADASWGVSRESGKKEDDSLIFTRQMAALYRKSSYDGKDRVLEMCYTDLDKTYQIHLTKDGSRVLTENFLPCTTRIDTPYTVWQSIAQGELRGDEALAKGMYSVSGDFSLMIRWDDFFGAETSDAAEKAAPAPGKKPPVMTAMLLPWILFWIALSIHPQIGAWITIGICGCLSVLYFKHEKTIYDALSEAAVSLLCILSLATGRGDLAVDTGYLLFGLMWLISCFTKEPLCAAYVKYGYGGDDALKNPIFMKTNVILAAAWGILYLLIAGWTFLLSKTPLSVWTVVINNGMTVLMGIFTAWFQNWYPAHVAAGKKRT